MDAPVFYPVAEDRVRLLRSAAVELAVTLPLFSRHGATPLQPDIWTNHLVQHLDHLRVIDQQTRRAARHTAMLGRQRLGVVFYPVDLIDDGGHLIGRDDGGTDQKTGQVKAELFLFCHGSSAPSFHP